MKNIITYIWFDKEAKEAATFYTSLFKNSKINNITTVKDTPEGDAEIVTFELAGQEFMAISGGQYFKLNPSISMFTVFDNEAEIDKMWNKLADGGKVLMEYKNYPWAHKYGWIQDRYGLSWQLSWSENHKMKQKIIPLIMYSGKVAGCTKDAIEDYTSVFPNSKIEMMMPYEKGDGDKEGFIKHSRFTLNGQSFMAMDSSMEHNFILYDEAISFMIRCDTQEEIDHYWKKLSAVPDAEQCGWLKDKYDVSWQIVPTVLGEMMMDKDKERVKRVTQAFLKMKKFDIKKLEAAFDK